MNDDERDALVQAYLRYLRSIGRADAGAHYDTWEELAELTSDDPEAAWLVTLEIVRLCDESDFGYVGADPLESLIWRHHEQFADRFEEAILTDRRFRDAFTYVRMGGVPLATQRRLNAALVQTGVDPETIVEFDEHIPDEP
jgi:hypothetical protein